MSRFILTLVPSRPNNGGQLIWRRYKCPFCGEVHDNGTLCPNK